MTERLLGKIVACMLCVIVPAALVSADSNAAMVFTSGVVELNGGAVQRSSAIFSGDHVRVADDTVSGATITATGSSVVVLRGSSLTFEGSTVLLDNRSAVSISTRRGMSARIDRMTVTPVKGEGRFQVARWDGDVIIAAKNGPVSLFDGVNTRVISEGSTEVVADPAAQQEGGAIPPAKQPVARRI